MCYAIIITIAMLLNPDTGKQEQGLAVFAEQMESRDWAAIYVQVRQDPRVVFAKCYQIV